MIRDVPEALFLKTKHIQIFAVLHLGALADDSRPLLREAIRARGGRDMRVHLIHDGTAACAVHAGEPDAALLLVGTALGIGFPPAETGDLRPLALTLDIKTFE